MRKVRVKKKPDGLLFFGSRGFLARVCLVLLGICVFVLDGSAATQQQDAKNVLVLFSSMGGNGDKEFLSLLAATTRSRVPEPITVYDAYLIYKLDESGKDLYLESEAETLRRTYAGLKLDLIIAVSPQAIRFAERYRDKLFPGVPILFTEVGAVEPEAQPGPGITGLTIPVGIGETIDLALRVHPDAQTVVVISSPGAFFSGVAHSELQRYRNRVREIDFAEPPSRDLLAKILALPPHTIVLFHLAPDSSRPEFGGWELLDAVAKRWPTYSAWSNLCLNHGCIGGAYIAENQSDYIETGKMAARILLGERPENIPVEHSTDLQVTVDWRALQYWHIPESAIPAGSAILFKQPTLWERGRKYFLIAIAVIIAQALLIFGLLWQRARKRKAEAGLRESEERFRVMADTTPSLIWMCDAHGKITYLNEQRLAFTGPDPDAGYGDTWISYIHPDDVKNVLDSLWRALKDRKPFSKEYRLHRSDGVYRWMFDVASPRVNGDGTFAGFIGSAIDVTDQKMAQQALEQVSGQLIEAQEKERTRIARDLHDDICQRLALLSMELEQAKRDSKGRASATKSLEGIRQHCSEIAGDVQSLSHQLHSSKLDYLGVVAAMRGFCKEFSKQNEVSVNFTDSDIPGNLPKNVSLCLFRVAQEALHNAMKYSGTSHFMVALSSVANEVRLQVADSGSGFDVEEAKRRGGLGLVSMQERVHLVHGRFSVESQPGKGTQILVAVPLAPETEPASDSMSERA